MKTSKSFFFLLLIFPFTILLGDIVNVPADTSTIQGGIFLAEIGDTVLVSEGTYFENINFKGKAITIASHFLVDVDTSHISKTIIDGSKPSNPDSGSVVSFISGEDTTSFLCGFTITGGSGTFHTGFDAYGGGGIYMLAGGKVSHNKIISNNVVSQKGIFGAGLICPISNDSVNIVIAYNEIRYNSIVSPQQSGGGGLYLRLFSKDGYCRVNNNMVSNNSVTCSGTYKAIGGGLGISLGLPTTGIVIIESNIISYNELHCRASIGGGIYVVYAEPGKKVFDYNPSPIISNNIITNNYSEDKGGGIGIWTMEKNHQVSSVITPQPAIINNTIVNNKANDGSGVFNFDSYPLLMNNIFWNDLSLEGSREVFNDNINYPEYWDKINGGELFVYYSDIQGGWEDGNNLDSYPAFKDTSQGDYSLSDSSVCIGWGIDSVMVEDTWYNCPPTDYYGNVRPYTVDKFVDVGAIESDYQRNPLGIKSTVDNYPNKYKLSQNYPNPFNPSTTIEFDLPKASDVRIEVYNIAGQKIQTLLNKTMKSGYHDFEFNAGNLSSGVYFYRIEAGEFQDVKKMILLR